MEAHPRATALLAFAAGSALTLVVLSLVRPSSSSSSSCDSSHSMRASRTDRSNAALDTTGVFLSNGQPSHLSSSSASPASSTTATTTAPPPPPIPEGIASTVGNTPLFRIKSLSDATGREILAKAEFLNGAGNSPKDRVALAIVEEGERRGLLVPHRGDKIYEGTVGSTGISLAAICRAKGYLAHICMPDDQATEKSALLASLGATVERVPPAPIVSTEHFVNLAAARAQAHSVTDQRRGNGFFADQFENEANWRAHHASTGPEILRQCHGRLDAFVAGAGTGGTISGVALYLKPRLPALRVVLADPQGSGLFNRVKYGVMFDDREREGTRRRRQVDSIVEGVGINRVTRNLEAGRELIDDAVRVNDEEAMRMARWLVEKDGIFVGSSSAVNCVAAVRTALGMEAGARVVTILCDSGTRHLSKFWAKAGSVGGKTDTTLDEVLDPQPG